MSQAYRNTRSILRFAREFYESRVDPNDNEADLNLPDDAQLVAIREEGEVPVVAYVPDTEDEIARAVNAALALKDGGLLPGKLLIIHANSSLESALRRALERG